MKKIRIAQIGMNQYSHAPEIFYTMKIHPEVFELVGYALVEDERERCAAKIDKFFRGYPELSLEEILNDPTIEAVTIETDEIHLLKYAQMAADHGKHIHMEKPGSQSLAEFEHLIQTVRESKKVFHVGYMYRYNPLVKEAIERVKRGELGHIWSVEAHMSRLDNQTTREWFGSFRGGMMFYLGCHLIDLVLLLQGLPARVIPLNTATGIDGVNTEDLGMAVLQYPNATSIVRAGGCEVEGFLRRQLVICGEKGTIEIKPLEADFKSPEKEYMMHTRSVESLLKEDGKRERTERQSEPFQRYESMMLAFGAMVRGEIQNPYTLDYELALFRTILQCCGM